MKCCPSLELKQNAMLRQLKPCMYTQQLRVHLKAIRWHPVCKSIFRNDRVIRCKHVTCRWPRNNPTRLQYKY